MANPLQLQVVLDLVDKASANLKNIVNSSNSAGKALRAAQEQMKRLESQQKSISAHRGLESQLNETSAKLVRQQRVLKAMQDAYQAIDAPTKKMTANLRKQADTVGALARSEAQQRSELLQSRSALAAAGIETHRLAIHEQRLGREVDTTRRKIDQQKESLARMAAAQERAKRMHSTGMITAAHGAGLAYGGVRAMQGVGAVMQPGLELEARMRDISITGGLDRKQESALAAQVRVDAITFGQTTELISQGLGTLVANGITAQQDLARYSGLLAKSSVASGAEVEDLSNLIVSLQRNLGLTSGQVSGALDSLAYAGKEGSFELRDMAKWMPQLAPMMAGLGVSGREAVDQLGAALQVARLGAGTSDEAANNLKNFLSKVVSQDTIGNFDKAGINLKNRLLKLQAQGVNPLQGSLQLITEYMGKKGPEATRKLQAAMKIKDVEQQRAALEQLSSAYALGELFRDQQAMAFIRPALMNGGEMQRIQKGASSANGALDRDYTNRDDTAGRSIDRLKIALGELKQQAFDVLKANIGEWAGKLSDGVQRLMAFAKDNPALVAAMVKFGVAISVAAVALGGLLMVGGTTAMMLGNILNVATKLGAGSLFSWVGTAGTTAGAAGAAAAGAAGAAAGAASLAAPLLLIATAGILIWKYWEPIKAFFSGMWDGVVEGMKPILPALDMLGDTLKQILAPADASEESLSKIANVGQMLGEILGGLITVVVVPLCIALQTVANVFKWVGTAIGTFIGFVVTNLGAVADVIKGVFTLDGPTIMAGFRAIWDNANQFFGGLPAKLLEIGRNILQGLINGIASMGGAVKDALAGVANGAVAGLKHMLGIKSPSRVFAQLGGFTIAGFTQGLRSGEGDAQSTLQRIGDGLRKTGAGIALGTLAAPALAAPALATHLPTSYGTLPQLQAAITPQLSALPALPPLTVQVTPQMAGLPALQARLAVAPDAVQPTPPIDRRPPIANVPRSGAGAASLSATYNITIHAAAGQQPQDIAALVRSEIERIEHQRRVRTRSELSDYE